MKHSTRLEAAGLGRLDPPHGSWKDLMPDTISTTSSYGSVRVALVATKLKAPFVNLSTMFRG